MELSMSLLQTLWQDGQPTAALVAVGLAVGTLAVLHLLRSSTPGPRFVVPVIGETLAVMKDPAAFFLKGYLRYGGVYKTQLLGMPMYCVLEPSAVRDLLKGDSSVAATFSVPFTTFNKLVDDWDHMVDGPVHDHWRKVLSVALSPSSIERCLPALQDIIQHGLSSWADRGAVPLLEASGDMALEFAMDVLVGVKLKHTSRAWFKQQMLQMFKGLFTLYLPFPGTTYSKAQAAKAAAVAALVKELQDQVQEIAQVDPEAGAAAHTLTALREVDAVGKQALLQTKPEFQIDPSRLSSSMERLKQKDSSASGTGAHGAEAHCGSGVSLTDAQIEFLRAQRRLTLEAAADRVAQLYLAAVDTTRLIIFVTLAMLAQLPKDIDKLREEQQQVISRHGSQLSSAALSELVYLEGVIKESSRLLSASRVGVRQAVKPLMLDGVHIPAGAHMLYSVDCMHCLEPTLWCGADSLSSGSGVPTYMDWRNNLRGAFQPSRWLPGSSNRPKHLLTFGAGSHLCLGMNLVYAEVKLLLSLLIRDYNFVFEDPAVLHKMAVFPQMKPAPGSDTMHITRRKGK